MSEPADQLVYGVPAAQVVDALRATGMAESDVIALVGRGVARSEAVAKAAVVTPPFVFQTQVAQTAPECTLTFVRSFVHPDFIDGVTVVQGGQTPEEIGFMRMHDPHETGFVKHAGFADDFVPVLEYPQTDKRKLHFGRIAIVHANQR